MKKMSFTAMLVALTGALGAAEFIHTPVLAAPIGEDLDVQAALTGAPSVSNLQVRLYFRQHGVEIYSSVVMGGSSSSLDASIPGAHVTRDGVEYYLEADSFSGPNKTVLATYPSANPALNPVEVVVRQDELAPLVTLLSPTDGTSVDSAMPVISASFNENNGALDLTSVVVKVDGKTVSNAGLDVYDTMVTYIPPAPLVDGSHTVSVVVTNKAGHSGTASCTFAVGASASESITAAKAHWTLDGGLWLDTQYGAVLKQPALQTTGLPYRPYGANQGNLAVNVRGPDDTFSFKVYDTDENRSDQQPLDRYTATWSNRQGQISLGDVSPSFSELSMYNLYELRGLDMNLLSGPADGGHTRFDGVWGQTESAVNGGAGNLTNTLVTPTYAQYLYGARWEAGNPYFLMGVNAVTVNDDDLSLSKPLGIQPQYNTVFTSDVRIGLPIAWLSLNGEAGWDYYAGDQTVLGLSMGTAYKAGLLWDARPLGSRVTFDWKDLGGGFGILPGGFSTMGNPGLQSDYRGFESTYSQTLMNGKLNFNLAENNWHDNLDGTKLATTTTNFLNAMATVAPASSLPYLNLGYTQTNLYNNGKLQLTDSIGNTTAQYVNQLTAVTDAGLGYARALGLGTGSLNLNYLGTNLTDMAPYRSTANIESWNLVLAAMYGRGLMSFNGSVGVGGSTNPAASTPADGYFLPTGNSNSVTAGLRWNQQWMASPFSTYLGWDLVQTDMAIDAGQTNGSGTLGSQVYDNARDTLSLGGTYKLNKIQKINLQLAYAMVEATLGTGQAGTSSVQDSLTELYCDLRYDLTF